MLAKPVIVCLFLVHDRVKRQVVGRWKKPSIGHPTKTANDDARPFLRDVVKSCCRQFDQEDRQSQQENKVGHHRIELG